MSFVDTFLSHYGVKGMRWGVRRRSRGGGLAPSEDKLKAEAAKQKLGRRGSADALSNEELRLLTSRISQEQNLSRLLANQKNNTVSAFITQKLKDTAADEFNQFAQGKQGKVVGTAITLGLGQAAGRHRKK